MHFAPQRNNKLGEQLRKVSASEDEQRERNKQLQETLERVREELRSTQVQAERSQQEAQRYPRGSLFPNMHMLNACSQQTVLFLLQAAAGRSD